MSHAMRVAAPTMLLAAGTFAGSAHAVTTVNYGITATTTAQSINIAGSDLYSFGLVTNGAVTPTTIPRLSSLGTAEIGICTANSAALDPNSNVYDAIFTSNPSTSTTSYANLRFALGGTTYYGTATFVGIPQPRAGDPTARLTQIRYGTLAEAQAEASNVPEPATWAEMIGGLGMTGAAMRAARRRKAQALATA